MSRAIQFYCDCYLDGMSATKCDQLTSAIFSIDGPALSTVSDRAIVAARVEYARMEANQC